MVLYGCHLLMAVLDWMLLGFEPLGPIYVPAS